MVPGVMQTQIPEEHAPHDGASVPGLGERQDLTQAAHVVLEPC